MEWFVEPVRENLKCGICKEVIREPRETPCGHIYCAQCISSWAGYYGICPERCREVSQLSLRSPINDVGKFISGLAVNCKFWPAGCRAQIKLAEKYQHEQICAYRPKSPTGLRKFRAKFSLSQQDLTGVNRSSSESNFKIHRQHSALGYRVHSLPRRSPSVSAIAVCRQGAVSMPVAMVSNQHLATC
jgi:hypothetical protein